MIWPYPPVILRTVPRMKAVGSTAACAQSFHIGPPLCKSAVPAALLFFASKKALTFVRAFYDLTAGAGRLRLARQLQLDGIVNRISSPMPVDGLFDFFKKFFSFCFFDGNMVGIGSE